jgi:hypothetical protein
VRATVFYSWQSDLPPTSARELLRGVLEEAINDLSQDASLVVRPALDHDTRDVPGSPAMVAVILEKIDECSVFVADVTLTYQRAVTGPARLAPNPNVLLELGYALKRLSHKRVLLLMNREFGGPEQLPFDLRGNRVIDFAADDRDKLVADVTGALHLIFTKAGVPQDVAPPVQIELKRQDREIGSALHLYRLPVRVQNTGEEVLANWSIEVTFPRDLLEKNKTYPIVRETRDPPSMVTMRQTQEGFSGMPLYPGDAKDVVGIDYYMDDSLYERRKKLYPLVVSATFYVGTKAVSKASTTVKQLVNY